MGAAIADVLPAAFGMALVNPLAIMAVILLLFSARANVTAPAFALGWMLGLFLLVGVVLLVIVPQELFGSAKEPTSLAIGVKLVLGALLIFLALRMWRNGKDATAEKEMPGWMRTLENASPLAALGFGATMAIAKPKNILLIAAAIVPIAQDDMATRDLVITTIVYVVIASLGVMVPVLWHAVSREQASVALASLRTWLTVNYSTVMAVIILFFGVVVGSQGLSALFGVIGS